MTDMDAIFNERPELQATDNQISRISTLMEEEHAVAQNIETHEAILADLKARSASIRHDELPKAMADSGVTNFTCASTGTSAKLTFECDGALGPEPEERERKIDVLISAGAEEIVKMECTAAFGKGEYPRAVALSEALAQDLDFDIEELESLAFQRENNAVVSLGLREAKLLRRIADHLKATTKIISAAGRNIHHMTLKSWVKERMEAGDALPLEEIGLWYGQVAKVKRPKVN